MSDRARLTHSLSQMKLWAVTCRDETVRLFRDQSEATQRAWQEDGDSEFDSEFDDGDDMDDDDE